LQDPPPLRSKAKLLLPNALGPELRCYLQDRAGAVVDPGPSASPGFGLRIRGAFRDTASSNQGSDCATFASCPDRPGGILDPLPVSAAGIRFAAASDNRLPRKRLGRAGTSRAEMSSRNSGNAVLPYGRFRIQEEQEFRN
jgi:hypothetical protein